MSAFQVTIESGIAELVFNKPPVNAFNSAEWASIAAKIAELGGDKAVQDDQDVEHPQKQAGTCTNIDGCVEALDGRPKVLVLQTSD